MTTQEILNWLTSFVGITLLTALAVAAILFFGRNYIGRRGRRLLNWISPLGVDAWTWIWPRFRRTPRPTPTLATAPIPPSPTTVTGGTDIADASQIWNQLLSDVSLLRLPTELNLILGGVVDFLLGYIVIVILMFAMGAYPPLGVQLLLAFIIGLAKYTFWSTRLLENKVTTFEMGMATFLERIIPTGPDGRGLRPGRYWLLMGWPFYKIAIKQDVREISVPFEQMQVWTKNSSELDKGAVQGVLDGLAQFAIIDPGAYNAVGNPLEVLTSLTHESARDAAEGMTAESFLATENDQLGKIIYKDVVGKLNERIKSLGVRCISVTVNLTDIKNKDVENGWGQVTVQRALATSRATDAAARTRRIRAYKAAGVDGNRAAAVDLVANGTSGAQVDDRRFNLDVGQSLKDVGQGFVEAVGKRIGRQP